MLDYLEVVLPGACSWSPRFESDIRGELRSMKPEIDFDRHNKDYRAVVDLRPVWGLDARVSFESRFRGDHKITVVNVGEKRLEQTLDIISQITDEHPLPLEVRRADLCADTPGVPVSWYASTVRAQWKQFEAKIGTVDLLDGDGRKVQWSEMGRRVLQTMYLGRRPNCFRIYDKRAERFDAWKKAKRAHLRAELGPVMAELPNCLGATQEQGESDAGYIARMADYRRELRAARHAALLEVAPFPDFEQWAGIKGTDVLTRVEREMAGGRVPAKLDRVYKLVQDEGAALRDFNPFTRLKGFGGGGVPPCCDDWSPVDWFAGMKMRELLTSGEWTRHELYQFLNRDRNGSRYEAKFRPFLDAATGAGKGVTAQQLFESYRESVTRQLAA